jgi:hypothetical protein
MLCFYDAGSERLDVQLGTVLGKSDGPEQKGFVRRHFCCDFMGRNR